MKFLVLGIGIGREKDFIIGSNIFYCASIITMLHDSILHLQYLAYILLNVQLSISSYYRWHIFSARLTGTHPLFSFPWPGTSDSGSTGSDCAVVYRPDTPCCPCRYSSGPFWLCAWRNPYSLRSCTRHNASLHTQIMFTLPLSCKEI